MLNFSQLEQQLDYEDNLLEDEDNRLYFSGWQDGFYVGSVLGIAGGVIAGIVLATLLYVYVIGL